MMIFKMTKNTSTTQHINNLSTSCEQEERKEGGEGRGETEIIRRGGVKMVTSQSVRVQPTQYHTPLTLNH